MAKYLVLVDMKTRPVHAGDVISDADYNIADLQKGGAALVPYVAALDTAIAQYKSRRGAGTDDGSLPALLMQAQRIPFTPKVPGNWAVVPDDLQAAVDALAAQAFAAPTITSITPNGGTPLGGDAVTIKGSGYVQGATVTIGGAAATSIVVVDPGTITCVTPARTAGAKDVVVTTPNGTATLTGGFTYASAPTFTSATPNSGTAAGGTSVSIVGTGFVPGTVVTIGGVAVTSFVIVDSAHITCKTGAHAAGAVDVVITNVNGTATGTGAYTYT